jgi:hypothetical protein
MSGFGNIVIGSGLVSSNPYAGTATNYSSLPVASTKDQQVWLVVNSEGTRWLPGSLGGTYFPSGYYWSNGGVWDYIGEFPYQALQADVDAGIIDDQFVSPLTLNNYSRWATKKNDSMSTNRLLGRGTAGTGVIEEIILGTNLSLTGNTLNATGGGGGGTVTSVTSATSDATITNPTTTPEITIVSAPKFTTARNINGVAFDGTANITVEDATKQPLDAGLTSISTLTGAGYVRATATDTFSQVATIPNTDITGLGTLATQSGTFSGTSSGTNTGDQTSIAGISGTKSQFNTAVTDGDIMYVGDAPTAHTHISTEITDFNSASRAQTEAELVAGTNITITPSASGATRQLTIAASGGGGGSLTTQDEGVTLSTAVTTLNFTGAGVTASGAGATTTINIAS